MMQTLQGNIFALIFVITLVLSETIIISLSDKTKYPKIDAPAVLLMASVITFSLTPFLILFSTLIMHLYNYVYGGKIAIDSTYVFSFVAHQHEVLCDEYRAFCDDDSVFHQFDVLALAACVIAGLRIALSVGLALLGRPSSLDHVKAMESSGKSPLSYAVAGFIVPMGGFWFVSTPGAYKSALRIKQLLEQQPIVMLIIVAMTFVLSMQILTELILTYICLAVLQSRRA